MDLKTFLRSLPGDDAREAFAKRCGTTAGHLRNVAYGSKPCGIPTAVLIEQETCKQVTRKELRADWALIWPELERRKRAATA